MRIVGTAGHVDHGKSALVRSLTGHDPDRWLEERERGMTLDLGFAPLHFADGVEAGIIDVPGHERFLHNLLAGAPGVELMLLVIDAVEGPRVQTFEHLQIYGLLGVRAAVVALTKVDRLDTPARAAAVLKARAACDGSIAQAAEIVAVSNVTGEGIEALKIAIHRAIAGLPEPNTDASAFMPVDRVFTLPGLGTVVTGTLVQGVVHAGDSIKLQPSGLTARIRSLEIFGSRVERASAGSRLAANIPSITVDAIERGEVIVAPNSFEPATSARIEFTALADAVPKLRRRTPVRVAIGAAEVLGVLALDRWPLERRASTIAATLRLHRPIAFYPGQRCIIRRMSPKDLLGGGVIVAGTASATGAAEPADGVEALCERVLEAARSAPLPAGTVAAQANVAAGLAQAALESLVEAGRVCVVEKPRAYVARAAFDDAFASVRRVLRECHRAAPWRVGCTAAEIAADLGENTQQLERLLAAWRADGRLAKRGTAWHMPEFAPALSAEQRAFFR
ncbi:MAG TPA: selenocysteine-specific translation elongation factor, partial [Candidatus Eremiobacteraceae bacterium]|nr:selenocysteine-specific translation elongation factor [Candidatus Eremiobacteraceae bacterium]